MIGRSVINVGRLVATRRVVPMTPAFQSSRQVHKGVEGIPPMRFMSVPVSINIFKEIFK